MPFFIFRGKRICFEMVAEVRTIRYFLATCKIWFRSVINAIFGLVFRQGKNQNSQQ